MSLSIFRTKVEIKDGPTREACAKLYMKFFLVNGIITLSEWLEIPTEEQDVIMAIKLQSAKDTLRRELSVNDPK